MVNTSLVNRETCVSNTAFSVKFSAFWADSCTSKTPLNIIAIRELTTKRCIHWPSKPRDNRNYTNIINNLATSLRDGKALRL